MLGIAAKFVHTAANASRGKINDDQSEMPLWEVENFVSASRRLRADDGLLGKR
jgi:hypothetical protein